MADDIGTHKLALEHTIMQVRIQLDALGLRKPSLHPVGWVHEAVSKKRPGIIGVDAIPPFQKRDSESPTYKQSDLADVNRWVEALEAPDMTTDPRIAFPDPVDDSEAETSGHPRVCYTDLSAPCSRQEWQSRVSKLWGEYIELRDQGQKLKQALGDTIATCIGLVAEDVLNDADLTPSKYTAKLNEQILNDMSEELRVCRKLQSSHHQLLPAFEGAK